MKPFTNGVLLAVFSIIFTHVVMGHEINPKTIKLGFTNNACDDGKTNLTKDFDHDRDKIEYMCLGEQFTAGSEAPYVAICQPKLDTPYHVCMQAEIFYEATPPVSGAHRYVWPEYGEYSFIPPQRWVHALEHGAIALLYHPCADPGEVEILRRLLVSCKRRYIITPYRNLTRSRPLALTAWGCKLEMGKPDVKLARDFIKSFSVNPNEVRTMYGGPWQVFSEGLLHKAQTPVGSTSADSIICPDDPDVAREIPIEDEIDDTAKTDGRKTRREKVKRTFGMRWNVLHN